MKTILVTGCNGLLGSNLVFQAAEGYRVIATTRKRALSSRKVTQARMDVSNEDEVRSVLGRFRPDVVIHCAAETNVDLCEAQPERAERINAGGTRHIARVAADLGVGVIFVSSDSVFDGSRGGYSETDQTAPLNVYSRTKLLGEQAVLESSGENLVVRTNMFGWNMLPKKSLSEWCLAQLREGNEIRGFADVLFSPLLVNDIASLVLETYEAGLRGLFHLGARDHTSKYEFALKIARAFQLDERIVTASSLSAAELTAPRPKRTYLDVSKVTSALGRPMPSIDDGVHAFHELERSGYVVELKATSAS